MNEAQLATATLVLFVGEFIGCFVFCVLFGFRSHRWWRTRMGPNLFAMMFVLTVLQGIAVLRLVFPAEWITANAILVRFWSFLSLFIVVWWRVILLWRIQHEDAATMKHQRDTAREALKVQTDGPPTDPEALEPVRD